MVNYCNNCQYYMHGIKRCQFCDFKPKLSAEPINTTFTWFGDPSAMHDAVRKVIKDQYLEMIDARIDELILLRDRVKNDL